MITRETDYALRMLRALSDNEQHTVRQLAEQELIPQPFAYKILKKLGQAGFVRVARGAEGGCTLTADLSLLSLYDLMQAMGDALELSSCTDPDYHCPWRAQHGHCSVHCRIEAIQNKLNAELKSHPLNEFLSPFPPAAP